MARRITGELKQPFPEMSQPDNSSNILPELRSLPEEKAEVKEFRW
jgi:hypothetical protein